MADCPHADIRFCPLYVASHGMADAAGDMLGCTLGDFHDGCAVERGDRTYADLVAKVKESDPFLVLSLQTREIGEAARQQRARNMAALNLH